MRLTLEGVASRPGVNGNGIRSVSNGVDIVCLMASTSMSGGARTRRVRNQKRAPPPSGVNGSGLRSNSNGGVTVCPMACTNISGKLQSLKRSKEWILLIKEKARMARNNDRFGGRLSSSVKLGFVSSE